MKVHYYMTIRDHREDWQTLSADLYLYAAKCVEESQTPFFDQIRLHPGLHRK